MENIPYVCRFGNSTNSKTFTQSSFDIGKIIRKEAYQINELRLYIKNILAVFNQFLKQNLINKNNLKNRIGNGLKPLRCRINTYIQKIGKCFNRQAISTILGIRYIRFMCSLSTKIVVYRSFAATLKKIFH